MTPEERRRAGGAVVERMKELGVTAAQVAARAGVDARTVRRMMAGETWPRDETRQRIIAALDLPPGAIGKSIWAPMAVLADVSTVDLVQELCKRLGGHEVSG